MTLRHKAGLMMTAFVAALSGGCDLGPAYRRPTLQVPDAFQAKADHPISVWPERDWWRGFQSSELNRLMEEAVASNFDLLAAIARVEQADAQVSVSGAPLLPTVSGTSGATLSRSSNIGHSSSFGLVASPGGTEKPYIYSHDYNLELSASYEIDFWGKNRAALESAQASALASRFDQQTVALTVVSSVADTWFSALDYNDRLDIARRNLATSERILAVIRGRLGVGTATALDLAQQQALVEGLRANIPALTSQRDQQVIGLGILVGRPPEAVQVSLGTLADMPMPVVAPGLPSELLQRRPDVANAEAQLIAANANIKNARAAFFPSVTLTPSGGYSNTSVASLFGPGALIGTLAATATQTIFDNGNLQGNLDLQKGKAQELLADYRKAVIQSFTDVENALTAVRFANEQEAQERRAVAVAQQAVNIAEAQLAAGTIDVTTVLNTQATLFTDLDTLAQVRLTRAQALVSLYKALGGGWIEPDLPRGGRL